MLFIVCYGSEVSVSNKSWFLLEQPRWIGSNGKILSGPSVSNELRSGGGSARCPDRQKETSTNSPPNTILLDTKMPCFPSLLWNCAWMSLDLCPCGVMDSWRRAVDLTWGKKSCECESVEERKFHFGRIWCYWHSRAHEESRLFKWAWSSL